MKDDLKIKMYSFTVDCKDPHKLANFYADLLKWEVLLIDENLYYYLQYPVSKSMIFLSSLPVR